MTHFKFKMSCVWTNVSSIKHICSKNSIRIPSFPSKSSNKVFYCFQCYENLRSTCLVAKQDGLTSFCDEGVLRMENDIFSQKRDQFRNLIPMLGGFYTTKCLKHSIGKFVRGSGLEKSLRQTHVFGVKIVDSILDGMH